MYGIANLSYGHIVVAPVPANSGTTFTVTADIAASAPDAPFFCIVWPFDAPKALLTNAEINLVTSKGSGMDWTATRAQQSTTPRSILAGDQIAVTATRDNFLEIWNAISAAQNLYGSGDPNGSVTGFLKQLYIDDDFNIWVNTDGGTTWI